MDLCIVQVCWVFAFVSSASCLGVVLYLCSEYRSADDTTEASLMLDLQLMWSVAAAEKVFLLRAVSLRLTSSCGSRSQ